MDKEAAVLSLTDTMAKYTAYIGKRLPKDVNAKLALGQVADVAHGGRHLISAAPVLADGLGFRRGFYDHEF